MQSTKFTPTSLDDFVFGNPISRERLDVILNGHSDFPNEKRALLLFGNAGTGKSELASLQGRALKTRCTMQTALLSLSPAGCLVQFFDKRLKVFDFSTLRMAHSWLHCTSPRLLRN